MYIIPPDYRAGTSPWIDCRWSQKKQRGEQNRWKHLTPKQREIEWKQWKENLEKERKERCEKKRLEEKRKTEEALRQNYINNRSPNALNDGEAVTLWLVSIAIGTIFNGRIIIWIIASILLYLHFTRESRRAAKWENGGREETYKKLEEILKGDDQK